MEGLNGKQASQESTTFQETNENQFVDLEDAALVYLQDLGILFKPSFQRKS